MALVEDHTAYERRERRRRDERTYAWVFWIAFPFFLALAVIARLTRGAIAAPGLGRRPSVFREAWVAANSSIPFAFMN
jgi:hypothetical protein